MRGSNMEILQLCLTSNNLHCHIYMSVLDDKRDLLYIKRDLLYVKGNLLDTSIPEVRQVCVSLR